MNNRYNDGQTKQDGTFEKIGEQLGSAAGRALGRGAEMAGGMMGSMVDTLMSTLGDWWSTADAEKAARGFDRADPACRDHFGSQSGSTGSDPKKDYEDVRPFYQFGYVASRNPTYRGRDFSEVEPDLRSAWGSDSAGDDWSDVRGYVDFGYTRDRMDRLDL